MKMIARHWQRIAVTLIPLLLALAHATFVAPIGVLQQLEDIIYDTRLRATMPRTLDERIVIVDIDEKSLAEVGRFPWGRDKLAQLVDVLFEQQRIAILGFDIVFAEPDDSSGLGKLNELAGSAFKDQPAFTERVRQLQAELDYDARFARSLEGRPVVLGYYFTSSDRDGHTVGALPPHMFCLRRISPVGQYRRFPGMALGQILRYWQRLLRWRGTSIRL
jgi:adenylate cyclase